MNSRMEKYYDSTKTIGKRSQKNEQLYKEVSKQSLEDFPFNSNATVLSDNGTSIDLDMLKDMLDKKYKDNHPHKSLNLDFPQEEEPISLEQTKEYDINAILEKAKESKTVDYETERLKKLRDTQYDILKSLDLTKKEEKEPTAEEEQLMELINTITINEQNNKEASNNETESADPLDLFKDLKGDDNTQVIEGLKEEVTKNIETNKIKKEAENQIDNSFYTKSFNLKKDDFEDFKDLEGDAKSSKVIVTILTIIIVIALLFGIFLFLNIYLDWGII